MSFDVSLSKVPEGVRSLTEIQGDQLPLGSLADVRKEVESLFESINWTYEDDKLYHATGILDGSNIEISLSKADPCVYIGFSLRGGSSLLKHLLALGHRRGWSLIDDQELEVMNEASIKEAFSD